MTADTGRRSSSSSGRAATTVDTHSKVAADIARLDHAAMKPGQLTVFSEIGQGRFKTVSEGCHCKHGRVAVLQYEPYSNRREVKILALISKHNRTDVIPEVFGVLSEPRGLLLAQELSPFGSVLSVLQDPELAAQVAPGHKLHMACQFAEAASFLESLRIIHTDLKCSNFLVFQLEEAPEDSIVKLTDFTCVLHLPAGVNHVVKKQPQATRWCAPETVTSNWWSPKTDAWSLGVTVWELFAGAALPWRACSRRSDVCEVLLEVGTNPNAAGARDAVLAQFPPPEAPRILRRAHEAAEACLQPSAKARRSSAQLASLLGEMAKSSANEEGPPPGAEPPRSGRSPAAAEPPGGVLQQTLAALSREWRWPAAEGGSSSASQSSDKMGYATPPTRCPSSPGAEFGDAEVVVALSGDQLHQIKSPNTAPSSKLMPHQKETLECIQALWSSPAVPQKRTSLATVESFLSTPEAVSGLSMDKQVLLRQKLAAALALADPR